MRGSAPGIIVPVSARCRYARPKSEAAVGVVQIERLTDVIDQLVKGRREGIQTEQEKVDLADLVSDQMVERYPAFAARKRADVLLADARAFGQFAPVGALGCEQQRRRAHQRRRGRQPGGDRVVAARQHPGRGALVELQLPDPVDDLAEHAPRAGADDDDLGVADIFGAVADEALDALVAQALDVGALGLVRALHLIA